MNESQEELTGAENRLRRLMQVWAGLFVFGGFYFLLLPDLLVRDLNATGAFLGLAEIEIQGGTGSEEFWRILGLAMMATIAAASWVAARDVRRHRAAIIPIVVSKLTSSALGLAYFALSGAGAFLAIFLADFPMALVTIYFYRRAGHT